MNKFFKNKHRGFTLIELLVVIAIIGLLSSVVLASLQSARIKGQDAAMKEQFTQFRSQAALFESTYPNFLYVNGIQSNGEGATVIKSDGSLDTYTALDGTTNFCGDSKVLPLFKKIASMSGEFGGDFFNDGVGAVCTVGIGGESYVLLSKLPSLPQANKYYCLDSKGFIGTIEIDPNDEDETNAISGFPVLGEVKCNI